MFFGYTRFFVLTKFRFNFARIYNQFC